MKLRRGKKSTRGKARPAAKAAAKAPAGRKPARRSAATARKRSVSPSPARPLAPSPTRAGWRPPPVPAEWIRTAADAAAAAEGCWFDLPAAQRVKAFFSKLLKHSKGRFAGESFELLEWEWRDIIAPVFGWKRPDGDSPETCTRRFRRAYVEVPKKNGKSTLASGIALYLTVGDGEAGAEVYCAAVDRDQAGIVFDEAARMVTASPHLARRLEIVPSKKRIVHYATNSKLLALSADVPSKEGLNPNGVIIDELHAWSHRVMWNTLLYGGAARRQPLHFVITTAGWDRTSIGWDVHEYAAGILNGSNLDTRFFAYIRAAEPEQRDERGELTGGDAVDRPATWRKANPSMPAVLSEEDFAADLAEARRLGSQWNAFLRYRLNIWTEQQARWLNMDAWRSCAAGVEALAWRRERLEALRGQQCYGALDLGATGDLTALTLTFGTRSAGYEPHCWFWCPRMGHWRENELYAELYLAWEAAGWLRMTAGNTTDYNLVRADINALGDRYGVRRMAVDRSFQGAQLCTDLSEDGFEMVPFGQGFFSMTAPSKALEEIVLAGQLRHGNNPILTWMAGNAQAEGDGSTKLKPVKPDKNSPLKIDGIVTLIMSIAQAELEPPRKKSVYNQRGIMRV